MTAPRQSASPAMISRFAEVLEVGMKLKKIMLQKGLTQCRTECPRCGGMIGAALVGRRGHLHMRCDGGCGMKMME